MENVKSIILVLTLAFFLSVTGGLTSAIADEFMAYDEGQRNAGQGKTVFIPEGCASDCPPPPFPPTHECLRDCKQAQLTFSGEGFSPQLGKYTWTGIPVAPCCPMPNGCTDMDARIEITTDEGTIYMEARGEHCRQDGLFAVYNGSYRVTGGTGRFEGVKGTGSVTVTVDYPDFKMLRHFKGTLKVK